jgi:hypothetical protein
MGDMLFYTEQLERISSSQQQAAHAPYVADYDRWPTREPQRGAETDQPQV